MARSGKGFAWFCPWLFMFSFFVNKDFMIPCVRVS